MNPINIQPITFQDGYVRLPFSRRQCAALSRACWFAGQESLDPERETWSLWAALFHTCAATDPPGDALGPPDLLPPELAPVRWQEAWLLLTLSLGHCASLARGCWFACQHSPDREPAEELGNWANLAGLFQLCVMAGLAQEQLDRAGQAEVAAGLRLLGLAELEVDRPG